jgi:hypothetical protein
MASVVSGVSKQSLRIVAVISQNCTLAQALLVEFYAKELTEGYAYIVIADPYTCEVDALDTPYAMLLTYEQSTGERFHAFVHEIGEQSTQASYAYNKTNGAAAKFDDSSAYLPPPSGTQTPIEGVILSASPFLENTTYELKYVLCTIVAYPC